MICSALWVDLLLLMWLPNIRCSSFGKYWFPELCRSSKCWYISSYNIKKKNLACVTDLIRKKNLHIANLSSSQWQIQIFQNSNFHLKAQILSLTSHTVGCFLWSDRHTLFIFEEMSAKYSSLKNQFVSHFFQGEKGVHVPGKNG